MAGVLYARPSDNVTASATPSLTAGSADSAYPLTNIDDLDTGVVFKATSAACTIRWTFGVAQVLQGVALFNHNLHGLTLTLTNNNGMASQSVVVPAVGQDGLSINPWHDLRSVALASATQWNLAISGAAANVAIGEVALLAALRDVSIRWEYTQEEEHPLIEHRTDYGRRLKYKLGVRQRFFAGQALLFEERDDIRRWNRECIGGYYPFVLIPNEDENDALFAEWKDARRSESTSWIHPDRSGGIVEMPLAFEEQQAGLAL